MSHLQPTSNSVELCRHYEYVTYVLSVFYLFSNFARTPITFLDFTVRLMTLFFSLVITYINEL